MNAYALADSLKVESSQMEYGYVVDDWKLLYDSATMLRQQADRIAELEDKLHWLVQHPVKQLSDEEIDSLINSVGIKPNNAWGLVTTGNVQLRSFARAIIKEITE